MLGRNGERIYDYPLYEQLRLKATYHKRKIYVPEKIVQELGLKDGDKVEYIYKERMQLSLKLIEKAQARISG